jgi:hypothetical protein
MRYLEAWARAFKPQGPFAYFHPNWSRAHAPLLDNLGAVIDHVEPHSRGGADTADNFVTACNKCNATKNAAESAAFATRHPRRPIRARYGEPKTWDGLSTVFVLLAKQMPTDVTASEAEWYRALTGEALDPRRPAGAS